MTKNKMYPETKTWNPAVGCHFNCIYCRYTFQGILRRFQGKKCNGCKTYIPHYHPERLERFPATKYKNIFMFGNGDISCYNRDFVITALQNISCRMEKYPDITLFLQSKDPQCFHQYLIYLPENTVLITTLETNRNITNDISRAPDPIMRYNAFREVDWSRKIITIEPIMNFDHDIFLSWIIDIFPESIYLGYNSKPKQVQLPEPSKSKFIKFYLALRHHNFDVVIKDDRNYLKAFIK